VTAEGIGKTNDQHQYIVTNEYVAGEIGRFLGLPVPPSYVVTTDAGKPVFISMNFNPRGADLPPIIPSMLVQLFPEEAAGILMFDAFIGNLDRHNGNLAIDIATRQLAVYDHSHALLGPLPSMGAQRLSNLNTAGSLGIHNYPEPAGHAGNRHCLLDEVSDASHIGAWLDKIEGIPDYFLTRLSDESVKLGLTPPERDALKRYLTHRKRNLRAMVQGQKQEFKKVTQWGLI
jgi:hypothetical protein